MSEERKESKVNSLYAQKRHHETKIEWWKKQKKVADDNLTKHTYQLSAIDCKLEKIEGRPIYITNHFLERWDLRVCPGDTEEQVREKVLTNEFVNMIRTLSNGVFPYGEFVIIVEDFKLLTIRKGNYSKTEKK